MKQKNNPTNIHSTAARIFRALERRAGTLAIINEVIGGGFRPRGAMLAIWPDRRMGSVSSGCIEEDIAHRAALLAAGEWRRLRYGEGSPWRDLILPCGGGVEVTLINTPDRQVMAQAADMLEARRPLAMRLPDESGALCIAPMDDAGALRFYPQPRVLLGGDNANLTAFAALAAAVGVEAAVLDDGSADWIHHPGTVITRDQITHWLDADSAMILFYHDHEREVPPLIRALQSPAFLIAAQGSRRSDALRREGLRAQGVSAADLARITAPLGVVGPARDGRMMAASALAQLLWTHQEARL